MGNCNCSCSRDILEREENLEIHNITKEFFMITNEKGQFITSSPKWTLGKQKS